MSEEAGSGMAESWNPRQVCSRATEARQVAHDLAERNGEILERVRRSRAHCLGIRDRIAEESWSRRSRMDSTLQASLTASRRRYATAVGRSPVIESAVDVIMERMNCSPGQAFGMLRELSQRRNEKLASLSERIVRTAGAGEGVG
jgi:hypothetical protein